MDKPHTTPKDFFLWAGAMIAFYWSVVAYIFLVFDYINHAFPDPLAYYPSNPYSTGISGEMASIIVLFPIYILLMWLIRADIKSDPTRKEIWVRRWALILTLFVGGATIIVDFIILLTTFLNGEALTASFLLKVLTVFLVAGGGFLHFVADIKGYWEQYPARKRTVCTSVSILALITVIAGFFIVGTPQQARLYRYDDQKVQDLTNIQWQIVNYWQMKQAFPKSLSALSNDISGVSMPKDPQTGEEYTYNLKEGLTFELCATFNAESVVNNQTRAIPAGVKGLGMENDSWAHGVGKVCFERTVDPELYPPL